MSRELWIINDECREFDDIKVVCDIMGNDKPEYASVIILNDEDEARYQAFLSEREYWHFRLSREDKLWRKERIEHENNIGIARS